MVALSILAILLLSFWAFSVWARDGAAAFMQSWSHVPLVAGIIVLIMAIVAAIR